DAISSTILSDGVSYLLFLDSNGEYQKASNTNINSARVVGIISNPATNLTRKVLKQGIITNNNWTWTKGVSLYLGQDGAITATKPIEVAKYVQHVGYAISEKTIYFMPNMIVMKNLAKLVITPSQFMILLPDVASEVSLVATESSVADSRQWYYGTTEGDYSTPVSPSNITLSYKPKFSNTGIKYVVCKSIYDGIEVTSAPVKILVGEHKISPIATQSLLKDAEGSTLTVTSSPAATSNSWFYGTTPTLFDQPLGTDATYLPKFSNFGIFYVVCKSVINDAELISNMVVINVTNTSITPNADQVIESHDQFATLSVTDEALSSREWFRGDSKTGPFNDVVAGNLASIDFSEISSLQHGNHYIVCKSTKNGVVQTSNPVKVAFVKSELTAAADQHIVKGSTFKPIVLTAIPKADSKMLKYGSKRDNITSDIGDLETYSSSLSVDSIFYQLSATYGAVTTKSNIVGVYTHEMKLNSYQKQHNLINVGGDTLKVLNPSNSVSYNWYYGPGDGTFTNLLTSNNSKSLPIFSTKGIYNVVCKSFYPGDVVVTSDSVIFVVDEFKIEPVASQTLQVNSDGVAINATGAGQSVEWFVQSGGVGSFEKIASATAASYTPKFSTLGEYKIICRTTNNSHLYTSDTVKLSVLDFNIIPNTNIVIAKGTQNDVIKVKGIPSNINNMPAWFKGASKTSFTKVSDALTFQEKFDTEGLYYLYSKLDLGSDSFYSDTIAMTVAGVSINGVDVQSVQESSSKSFTAVSSPVSLSQSWRLKAPDNSVYTNQPFSFTTGKYKLYCDVSTGGYTLTDSIDVYAGSNVITPLADQFVSVNKNIDALTITSSGVNPTYQWKYTSDGNSTATTISGSLINLTDHQFTAAGTYNIKADITYSNNTYPTNSIKVVVVDCKLASTADQTIARTVDGTVIAATGTTGADEVKWFYGTAVNAMNTQIVGASGVSYTPKFETAGVYYISFRAYFGTNEVISSNNQRVKVIGNSITETANQYLKKSTNGAVLNLVESPDAAASRKWYYSTSSSSAPPTGETAILNNTTSYTPSFSNEGIHYYVYSKSTFAGNPGITVKSNSVRVSVPSLNITPSEIQGAASGTAGNLLTTNEAPYKGVKAWYWGDSENSCTNEIAGNSETYTPE
ncbi:MAG: hypothetical protein GY787_23605, partial [Alteromonadales bacterium]|nr:hypothetical protein [Alteromonadales bacterium]